MVGNADLDRVAGWAIDHFNETGTPIGPDNLEARFWAWADNLREGFHGEELSRREVEAELVATAVNAVKQPDPTDSSVLLDIAIGFLNKKAYQLRLDHAQLLADEGRIEESRDYLNDWQPFSLNGHGDLVEPFPVFEPEAIISDDFSSESFLIDGVLVRGQSCILAGAEKSLKTLLTLDLMASLATGRPFLGQMPVVEPASTLFFSGEVARETLFRNLRTILHAKFGRRWARDRKGKRLHPAIPHPSTWESWFAVVEGVPMVNDLADLDYLRKRLDEYRPDLFVIDTANLAIPGADAPNQTSMSQHINTFVRIGLEYGAQLLLIHHARRKSDNVVNHKPLTLKDIAYEGYAQAFRQWILINHRTEYEPPEDPEKPLLHHLWLKAEGNAQHSQVWGVDVNEGTRKRPRWKTKASLAGQAKATDRKRKEDAEVRRLMEVIPEKLKAMGPLSATDIERKADIKPRPNWEPMTQALNCLVEDGVIELGKWEVEGKQKRDRYRIKETE